MKPIQIIFEKGVTIHREENGRWLFSNITGGKSSVLIDPNRVYQAYGVRPILITYENVPNINIDFVIPKHIRGRLLEIDVSELMQTDLAKSDDLYKVFNIGYTVGAVVYHCKKMACCYREICRQFVWTPIPIEDRSGKVIFSAQQEPYYEFDALITAARRAYDTTRYILWKYFGPGSGSVPASFQKCLPMCKGFPNSLQNRLKSSWDDYGERLTNYRDCIQHYAPIDFGLSSAHMTKLGEGVWSASLLIPDNPEVKSKAEFKYLQHIDALSYSWEITTEVVNVAKLILSEASKKTYGSAQQGA